MEVAEYREEWGEDPFPPDWHRLGDDEKRHILDVELDDYHHRDRDGGGDDASCDASLLSRFLKQCTGMFY